jgi:hypothetical protein
MTEEQKIPYVDISTENTFVIQQPKYSNYTCYMFGNRPGGVGITYIPQEGRVPNAWVRFWMWVFLDCLWVEEK